MSIHSTLTRFVASVLVVGAGPVMAGSINYSTLDPATTPDPTAYQNLQTNLLTASPFVQLLNVTETWTDPQAAPVLTPPAPTATPTGSGLKVNFTPSGYSQVQTGTVSPIELVGKNSTFSTTVLASATSSDPGIARYAISNVSMDITGGVSVWAPFPPPTFSFAQATATATYNVTLKAINGVTVQDQSFGGTVPLTLVSSTGSSVVSAVSVSQTGPAVVPPTQDPANYTWFSNLFLTQNDLRAAFNITDPEQYITELSLTYTSNIAVGSIYAQATSSINTFSAGADTVAVPVPEPPTVILAGLGAAAVVGSGWRRKMLRKKSDVGAVSITA